MRRAPPVSPDRWRVLEPLLDAALDLAPDERDAFVETSCPDGALRRELLALIAACERGGSLLEVPAVVAYEPLLAEAADAAALPLLLGGRYRIVREIGRGGMATVFLADDPRHRRQVAIKVLHGDVARLIGRERFLREIEIVARLSHPHILPLHDSGEMNGGGGEGGSLYFVTPFVSGESLRDRLNREPALTLEETVRLGREIAQALDYAHRQGVVHLDVKPENILLQDGHAVVADFGIARAMTGAAEEAGRDGTTVLGTPSYMSPEQARGEHDIDGRSDVYSLGCMLFEMIAGRRPFSHSTHEELLQHAMAPRLPDRSALLRDGTRELAAVIERAMAPQRDRRFATAGELAHALGASPNPRTGRSRRWASALLVSTAAVAIAGVAFWVNRGAALDPDLVAVAPFDVAAPSLSLWKEGLVDVLSRNLDGAGPLRAVPATVAVRVWEGRADTRSARLFGQRTGARLVLYGGLLGAGDSVRATATLLDAVTGQTLAQIERRDEQARIDRLSDSITVAVLRELGRTRQIDLARAASSPTTSLGALKAYLQGEQFYRAALWDSAQARFEQALSLDSTLALAYHRLAAVRRWRDPQDVPDSTTFELMRRTSRFPQGLAPRERLLATADSLYAEAEFAWRRALRDGGSYADEQQLVETLIATLGDGLLRYRGDPELAFLLAETRWRYDRDVEPGERDDLELLALYDRAIAYDSSFAPAYLRPISLAAYLSGPDSARLYIRAYLARAPSGPAAQSLRLDDTLLDPARAASLDFARLADSLPPESICEAAALLRHVADSTDVLVRLARALERRPADGTARTIPQCAVRHLVNGLLFRGHLRDAYRFTTTYAHWLRPMVTLHLSRYAMVPPETARAEFDRVLALAPATTMVELYPWWAEHRDVRALRSYIAAFEDKLEPRMLDQSALGIIRADLAAGHAYLALARRDTASALDQLLATRDTLHDCWYMNRLTTVELLVARRRDHEAAERLERRWPGTSRCSDGADDVEWMLLRGRVFERLGRREQALASYTLVADAWRTADPELQGFVREAHDAIERLAHPGRRRPRSRLDRLPIGGDSSRTG